MNNNFKKLLASAMALAMVTSVMPATGVSAYLTEFDAENAYCDTQAVNFVAGLKKIIPDLSNVNLETTITLSSGETNLYSYVVKEENRKHIASVAGCYTIKDELQEYAEKLIKIVNGVEMLFDRVYWDDIDKTLDHIEFNIEDVQGALEANVDKDGVSKWLKDNVKYAVAYNDYLLGYEFEENLTTDQYEVFDEVRNELSSQLEAFGYTSEKELDKWIETLESNYDSFVKDVNKTSSKTAVENAIKEIKNDVNYKLFKDEPAVEAIIEQYETILEEIEAVKDATNSKKNDAYVDYIKKTKGSSVATRVEGLLTTKDADTLSKQLAAVEKGLSFSDYEVLKGFMDEVVAKVWNFETKQYGNYYVDKSTQSPYATSTIVKTVLDLVGGQNGALVKNFDREEGTFGWDELQAYMEGAMAHYDALTEGIKGLDAINITVNDKKAILAADDALYFFEGNTGNLTTAQKREVRNAERKVSELLEAYRVKFGSVTGATGWVDMGNGNWKYYEEDGTAPTKWICTAKDTWYYVSNGVMLRDAWVWRDSESAYYVGNDGKMVYGPTTVKGYELDANGLWHK